MLTRFFDRITQASVRARWITLLLTILVLIAGGVAFTNLNQELLPPVEFPQTFVLTSWPDADSTEQLLEEVTRPLEDALSQVEGVVNVESNTTQSIAIVIVRNEFGLNQDRVVENIEAALDGAPLPEGAEPDIFNFSLSDLPVVVASISSDSLTLQELKAAIENPDCLNEDGDRIEDCGTDDLVGTIVGLEGISQVSISGGQELPEPVVETEDASEDEVMVEEDSAETEDVVEEEAEEVVDPGELSPVLIAGLSAYGIEVDNASDVTPEEGRILIYEGGELSLQALRLLTPENMLAARPDTMAYLPSDFTDTLDQELVDQLNEYTAEFGGVGQYTIAEALEAKEAGLDILTGEPIDGTVVESGDSEEDVAGEDENSAEDSEMEEAAMVDEVEPVELPAEWIAGAAQGGLEIETTADLTPEFVEGLVSFAPESLDLLTPDMLLALPLDVIAILPVDYLASLDEDLLTQLQARAQGDSGGMAADTPDPVALPAEWIAGAAQAGLEIETTADLTPEFVEGLASFAPESFEVLTPEMVLAMPLDVLAVFPIDYLAGLDEDVQAQLQARIEGAMASDGMMAAPEPVALPEEWIAGAAQTGAVISTTADLTVEFVEGLAAFAPESFALLTPEMLLAMSPELLEALPADFVETLDDDLQAELAAIIAGPAEESMAMAEPDPIPLPDEWIEAAAAVGAVITTTADISPEFIQGIIAFAPETLALMTPDIVLALPTASLAELPAEFIETLDPEVQEQVTARLSMMAEAEESMAEDEAVEEEEEEAVVVVEPEPVDPKALSPLFATVGEQIGATLETTDDITPDFIRQVAGFGEQGLQLLGLFSPENLRELSPEAIGLLPMEFLDTIEDEELLVYLDGLAVEYGGAGQLAITEAEEAAALSAESPPMTGIWLEPGEDGSPAQFQTAGDLLTNPFAPTAADFLNFFPNSPQVEDVRDWMGEITPNIVQFLADNEEGFVSGLDTVILEVMPPETLNFMLENFPDSFDDELAGRLSDIAAGDVEVFIPESSITRNNGNPSLILQVFKEGDANTVEVFDRIEEQMLAFQGDNNIEYVYAFEQASFIEKSIRGVSQEGLLGAAFAVIVILIFLSGSVNGKYKLSLRATLITGMSIPASILFAFLLMYWLPRTIGTVINDSAEATSNGFLNGLALLFPTNITLNIMTLSGLTVAIGRVVDDSIVVLENSYRYIQKGEDPAQAVYKGTREVAVAIFSATVTTMAVFLPLGFVGGVISEFFLPFGLTVTYALAASYIVSITVVPALTFLLIHKENIPDEKETWMQRSYTPILEWALRNRVLTMAVATLIFAGSTLLLTRLPNSFIPGLGDPTVNVTLNLPPGTTILDTNEQVADFEDTIKEWPGIKSILTEVGSGGGTEAIFTGGGGVSQNQATLTISVVDLEEIDNVADEVREEAIDLFGGDAVRVSAAIQSGFSGFGLIVTGDELDDIVAVAADVEAVLAELDADGDGTLDMVNITSNAEAALDGTTVIRIDGQPAITFSGELQTNDTLGVTQAAKDAIAGVLPSNLEVTEGFDSQQQTEGFQGMISAIGVSIFLVYAIMALTFRSFIHPFTILFSLPFALVGAAIALFITSSVLGISAMMGLLMLVGVVVTNGIVLMELVQQLREEGKPTYDSLVEAGRVRLRPIWMTALTAILALIPLATSTEGGAIIAAELGTTVIGGLIVSTALTLIVIPVVYSLFDQGITWWNKRRFNRLARELGIDAKA